MYVQTREAAALVGMPAWQVQSYAKQGFVEPVIPSHGAGSRRAYNVLSLVKLGILKRLSEGGFDLRTIRPIFTTLFDSLQLSGAPSSRVIDAVRAWFAQKLLITCRQFSLRKMIRRERLAAVLAELLPEQPGLYIIDIGAIVEQLLDRVVALQFEKVGR